jgi:hypothetical protein
MKKYWLTPHDLKQKIFNEFGSLYDVCPFPLPDGFDCLKQPWSDKNFCNPPFRKIDGNGFGPTAFVRKAIEENKQGKSTVLIIPTQSYVNLLIEAGAELRSLGRVKWIETGSGLSYPNPSPTTMFILK